MSHSTSEQAEPVIGQAGVGMDAALKAKWVGALRSGKYEQAKGSLRECWSDTQYGFCCLGVLCDVVGATWDTDYGETAEYQGIGVRRPGASFLSDDMLTLVGMEDHDQQTLASMNDSGQSFDKIADHIEANIPVRP